VQGDAYQGGDDRTLPAGVHGLPRGGDIISGGRAGQDVLPGRVGQQVRDPG
jgi:hypothetical protein